MEDIIIIGKGPAGISCAIYLARYGYKPLIIAKDGGALERVEKIENYYGFESISGSELLENGYNQARKFDLEIKNEELTGLDYGYNSFVVKTNKNTYEAKVVVLALGQSRNKVSMLDKYSNVSYCATCDGFFYKKKNIALIGNTEYMKEELNVLSNFANVTVFTDGLELDVDIDSNINVVKDKITGTIGDSKLEALVTNDNTYNIDGCFVAKGNASGFTLAKHMGLELNNTSIVVDDSFKTNIDGIYACGDIIGGLLQVSKAVSDGAKCATSISKYLKSIK